MTESAIEPKKRFWVTLLRPKVAIPLGLFVLLLLSPVLYRGWNLGHVPDLGDPFPAELLKNPTLSDEDNAWVNYQRAKELWVLPSIEEDENEFFALFSASSDAAVWITLWNSLPSEYDVPAAGPVSKDPQLLKHYFNQNQTAVEEWKTGTVKSSYFEKQHSVQPWQSIRWDDVDDEDYYPLPLHELGILKAGQLASQGKHTESLDWMLAVYRYSRHLTQSGGTKNWERAIAIGKDLFAALDELLDHEAFTHDDLIAFLHELERSYDLTGTIEQALTDDYLKLKQQVLGAYEKGSSFREEFAEDPFYEAGSSVSEQGRFQLYVEGEPQLSLRFLQHHFESLKSNLKKPVGDRVLPITVASWGGSGMHELTQLYRENPVSIETAMSADQMEAFVERVGLLREVVGLSDLFTNPFLREDDQMVFESLRILVAAHALARRSPFKTNWDPRLLYQLNTGEQFQIEALPVVTMEELVSDSLIETPHDPYHPSLPLIIATQRNGEVFIFSSTSVKYDHLANGEPLESVEQSDYWYLSLVYKPTFIEEPQFRYLTFHLPIDSDDQARLTE